MTGLKPGNHARDHWADGPDPAASKWYVAGEGDLPDLEAPWTGTLRWRFDGNGDLELDGDIDDGTFEDPVIFLPSQFWPAVTRTRPGWLTSEGALVATTVASSDGEVTVSEVTVTGGGGGGAAADVTFTPAGGVGSTNVQDAIEEVDSEKVPNGRTITAGAGLSGGGDLSANRTVSVNVDDSTVEISSDTVRLKAGGVTSSHIADGTIATGDLAFDPATQAELDAHTGDTSGAHAASAISVDSTTLVGTGTDAQAVFEELDNAIAAIGVPNAEDIPFTPAGSISATDVQAAIQEVAAEAGSGGAYTPFVYAKDMWPSTTGGASGPNVSEMTTNKQNVKTVDFADGSDLKAEFSIVLPSSYAGETFTFRVVWMAAGTATDGIVFGIEARAVGNNEDIDGSWSSQTLITDAHTSTANRELYSDASAGITASNSPAAGDTVFFRLQRVASNGSDALAQTVKVLGVALDFTGDGAAAMPSFVAAGSAVDSAAGSIAVPFPASLANGDLMLAQIIIRNNVDTIGSAPSGWALLPALSGSPDSQSSTIRQWIYYKVSAGTETGTEAWTSSGTALLAGRMYAFRGVDASISESGGKSGANDASIVHTNVVTTGPNRLAVCFICVSDDNTLADMTGETGGDWTRPVSDYLTTTGSDGALSIQTAGIALAGTISGGGITMSASDPWISRSLALLPVGA